jgi:DNA helicase-2/ATP-dependent DNA helicase PcrA
VFTDDKSIEGIRLSSIHKAKGLEANRVVLLQLPGASIPHSAAKTDWQKQQERNLLYVAITRAITTLTYVY